MKLAQGTGFIDDGVFMDLRIAAPTGRSDELTAKLFSFLGGFTDNGGDGFVVHVAEPAGEGVIHYLDFACDDAGQAFKLHLEKRA
jgi:hypothetical protein